MVPSTFIFTARQQSCGEGMFSQEFVCLSRGPHVTITHNALDLTVQGPFAPSRHRTWGPSLPLPLALVQQYTTQ